jgi:hypothetical protein
VCGYASGTWGFDTAERTLAQWRTAHPGWDVSSLSAAPGFASATDFTPADGSPLLGRAHPIYHSAADVTGKVRDTAPDAGAYEK